MNICLTILLSFFVFPLYLQAASALKADVSAKGAILINAETGAVLWEKNAHTPLHPASTTKMITALYAAQKKPFSLEEELTASHDAVLTVSPSIRRAAQGGHPPYRLEFGGTHMGIKLGETLSLKTLFYGLMLRSGNDAANMIAEHTSGSISAFVEELNAFVREKGCKNTVLFAPHGLPWEGHRSTAYDMGLLAREFLNTPFLREVVSTKHYVRPQTNKQPESVIYQMNALIKPGKFYYPKAIGIKTGYTIASGYCLVGAAEDENRKLIAVLLGCQKMEQRYQEVISLFEAAFNEKKVARTLFSKGFDLFSRKVEGGSAALEAYLSDNIVLEYYPSEEPIFKASLLWQNVELPIKAGQAVGFIEVISSDGKRLTSAPLYSAKNVEATFQHRFSVGCKNVKKAILEHAAWVMAFCGLLLVGSAFYCTRWTLKSQKGK